MKKNRFLTRMTALLLVLVCMLGLLPTVALAADAPSSIKLEDCTHNGVHYESPSLGTCWLHQMTFDYNQKSTIGFCAEHGKGMGWSLEGQTWGNPKPITDPTVKTMMAYYYAHTTGVFTDQAHALGVDEIWGSEYSWTMNAWVQAIVWRYKAGLLNDPATACAEELVCVYNNLHHGNYSGVDDLLDGMSFRDRAQYILDLGKQGVWGDCTVHEYAYTGSSTSSHQAKDVQAIMIGELNVIREKYDLIVKKVDATNPNKGLPGARFIVRSENGTYEKEVVTGSDGTYTLSGLDASTYSVVELAAPEGYEIDNAGPQYVALPNGGSNTVTVTFLDSPEITSEGSIRKVDADDPTKGLAGAVIKIEGTDNSFVGTYTTGAGGYLEDVPWDTLPIGSFTATEVTPPEGYSLSPDPDKVKQSFYWDGKTDVALVFENDARVKVKLVKYDDSGDPLPGAVFNIVRDGQIIGTEATQADGSITVPNVTEGMYAFVEVSAPAPFACLTDPVIVHVDQATVEGGGTVQVTAKDQRLPNLTIWKRDGSDEDTVIPGTVFEVKGIHSGFHTDVTTGEDGKAVLTALPVDSFEVTEKSVPEPYVVGDEPTQTIWLGPGDDKELIFTNEKQPLLTIAKSDADDPTVKVPGTVFLVEGIDSDYEDEWTTGEDGTVSKRVDPGSYQVTEKSVPSPYYISETESERVQTISLNPGDEKTLSFENHKRPFIEIIKENSITHDPIENVKMQVWYASNNTATGEYNDLGVYYTDSEGRILLSGPDISLRDGWYRVKELEPAPGFALPDEDTQEVFIPAGGSHTFHFQDRPLSAICVWKYDSKTGAALSDCWFQVRYLSGNTSGSGGTVIGVYRTSANGSFTVTGCKAGTYIIEELSSDGSHVIDTPPQTVYLSGKDQEVVEVHFGNSPKGSLLVTKISDDDKKEPLSGVEFLVTTSDGTVVGDANGKFVTDSSGSFLIEGLDPGTVLVVREVRAKPGYLLDDTPQTAEISKPGQTVTLEFRNKPLGNLIIHKLSGADKKTPLEGVQFKVTYADGSFLSDENGKLSSNGLYWTNSDGQIILSGVTGTVIATEVQSAPGYTIDPNTQSQTVVVNPDDSQHLYFYNDPEKMLVLQKNIYDGDKNDKPLAGVEFLVTDSTGAYIGPDNGRYVSDSAGRVVITGLTAGMTITAKEVSTVSGYVLDSTPQTIEITEGDEVQTLYFYNKPEGGIELTKVNEADKTERIPNTTFEIRKAGDDALVDTVTTGKDGKVYLPLKAGDYYAVETDCPSSFRLDATPIYFTVEDGQVTRKTVTNQPVSGILIHKVDPDGAGIPGAVFLLYDSNHKPIGQYTSNDRGYVYIDDLTEPGRYYLRELENEGYIVDEWLKTVYVRAGQVTEVEWENTPITGQIQVTKTSADYNSMNGWPAGTPIPGTVFEVYHARTGNLVDTIRTDKNGVAVSKPLPLGRYKIVESQAADFYALDKTPIEVEIEHEGQIVKAAMTNKSLYTNVAIQKTGYAEVMPGQNIRYTFSGIANNSTTSLTSFYWRDTLPVEAVRLAKITTGTYNAAGNYKIVYKTNLSGSEYRVLADSLNTQQNYVLDASPVALRLGSNEYITEVMFVFGVVPSNFRQVETPMIDCSVVSWGKGGSQFVNQADVGGVYDGQWIMATSRWVTKVYAPSKPLPRTGY